MKKKIVLMCFLLSGFLYSTVKTIEFADLVEPNQIVADSQKGNLYIVDGTSIYIYSLKDFKLKKKFGKNGEGPKEFKRRASITLTPKYLIVNSIARVTFFTKDGEYIKEVNTKTVNLGPFLPIGDNYINTGMDRREKTLKYALNIYDSNFTKIKPIGYFTRNEQPGKKINAIDWGFPKFRVYKDRIYCEELDNELYVFDKDGKKLNQFDFHKLIPDYKKVKVTDEYKKRFYSILKLRARQEYERVKKQLKFPEYFTIIRDYMIKNDKIYVISFIKKKNKSEVHVFDLNGKYIRTFFQANIEQNAFSFYPMDIENKKLYQLYENEETWTLSIEDLKM